MPSKLPTGTTPYLASIAFQLPKQRHLILSIIALCSFLYIFYSFILDSKDLDTENSASLTQFERTRGDCLSENVFVRSSYIYNHQLYILVEISTYFHNRLNSLLRCQGGTKIVSLVGYVERWINENQPKTHLQTFLRCEMPQFHSTHYLEYYGPLSPCPSESGSIESLKERQEDEIKHNELSSKIPLRPLISNPNGSNLYKHQYCAVVGVLDDRVKMVDHWIFHQRSIGIQHIFFYVTPSFNPSHFVSSLMNLNYLDLIRWPAYFNESQIYYRSQLSSYVDSLFRFRGDCEWTIFLDTDDYFTHFPSENNLKDAVEARLKINNQIDAIKFPWINFIPECDHIDENWPYNVSFVKLLKHTKKSWWNTKFMAKTNNRISVGIHTADPDPGFITLDAAVYHVRFQLTNQEKYCSEHLVINMDDYRDDPRKFEDYISIAKNDRDYEKIKVRSST